MVIHPPGGREGHGCFRKRYCEANEQMKEQKAPLHESPDKCQVNVSLVDESSVLEAWVSKIPEGNSHVGIGTGC